MWCPNCKNEFVEGITVCPKCGVDLVNSLQEEPEQEENSFESVYGLEPVFDQIATEKFFEAMDERFGENIVDAGYSATNANEDEKEILFKMKEISDKVVKEEAVKSKIPYQNKKQKAEDIKGSAISLLFVGVVGIVFLVLLYSGVLPIHLEFFTKITIGIVMGGLFLTLIIMSFVSFKSLKGAKQLASAEDKLTEEIEKWYKENLSREYLEEMLASRYTDSREETKYFVRYAAIKSLISNKFMNLDERFLDHICEETYNYIYGED